MITIERATVDDANALLAIYGPYVTDTAITFEYEIPSLTEFENRIRDISSKYPYLKAVEDGQILGYAYATSFKGRRAYDWSVETTIYLRADQKAKGIGRLLYQKLEESLRGMGILNMNACIAIPKEESPYVTMDSVYFHEKMGFEMVGTFHDSGFKFQNWFDMVWMEKMIGEHPANVAAVDFGNWQI